MGGPIKERCGQLRSIWWADSKSRKSLDEALSHSESKKRASLLLKVQALLEKLSDYRVGHRRGIQKESFPDEGFLPASPGAPASKYQAVKKIPVRLYGWFYESEGHPQIKKGDFIISHCVHKDYQKKKKEEDVKIRNKWRKLEVGK